MTDDLDQEGFRTVYPTESYVDQDKRGPVHAISAMEEEKVRETGYEPGWKDPRAMSKDELIDMHVRGLSHEQLKTQLKGFLRAASCDDQHEMTAFLRQLLDNAVMQSKPQVLRGPGIGEMVGLKPGEMVPVQMGMMGARMEPTRLDRVVKEKRVSKVFRIWDWPRGVRDRGWGLLHDQIWFYDTFTDQARLWAVVGTEETDPIFRDTVTGHFWRSETVGTEVRWLRLYMDRKMLWLPRWVARLGIWNRLRIHNFHSGDDDSAPHDHPWGFVTFPLSNYTETVECKAEDVHKIYRKLRLTDRFVSWVDDSMEYARVTCVVRRFRFHWRNALHRHFVHEPERPFTTIVAARETLPPRKWGFWPTPTEFVPYDVWTKYTS